MILSLQCQNKQKRFLNRIEKEVQSHNNKRTKVAILNFSDFEMNDQFALLRSRSNADFKRKCISPNDNKRSENKLSNTNYDKFFKK